MRPFLTQLLRIVPLVCTVLLTSCEEPPAFEDLISEADAHSANGRYDLAVAILSKAVKINAADPELRLVIAEYYIGLGRGDLAEVTIKQSVDRGLDPSRALVPYARALLLQKNYHDVRSIETPENLPPLLELELKYLKTKALVSVSISNADYREITEAYLELIPLNEKRAGSPISAEITAHIQKMRGNRHEVERAWQHIECKKAVVEPFQWSPINRSGSRILRVGPARELKNPRDAARVAQDGDVVEIDPGNYPGGIALWSQNQLTVRGSGVRPVITANGKAIQKRDVWLFTGNGVVVENVEISGARSPYENGAGIRHIGIGLQLRHVFLHDNENGVLTGNRHPDSEILIEYSEFANNGDAKGFAHNVYVGRSKKLEFRFNYSHGSSGGHLLKSRAFENIIAYNRLSDNEEGDSSYIVDLPEGGIATVIGNVIQQGYRTRNHTMISYAGEKEKMRHEQNQLTMSNNTVYNRDLGGIVVRNHSDSKVRMINNLFGGAEGVQVLGPTEKIRDQSRPEHGLVDPKAFDFRLLTGAYAIDTGSDLTPMPTAEYVHPVSGRTRLQIWRRDVGAYERCGI